MAHELVSNGNSSAEAESCGGYFQNINT